MDALLAFAASLVALRLAAELVRRRARTRAPELGWWAASLAAFAVASAALAWGSAAGWDDRSFRLYYLTGGLLTAALLGAGSLVRIGWSWVGPVALVYVGLAIGIAVAEPLTAAVAGSLDPRRAGAPRRDPGATAGDRRQLARHARRRGCGASRRCGAVHSGTGCSSPGSPWLRSAARWRGSEPPSRRCPSLPPRLSSTPAS